MSDLRFLFREQFRGIRSESKSIRLKEISRELTRKLGLPVQKIELNRSANILKHVADVIFKCSQRKRSEKLNKVSCKKRSSVSDRVNSQVYRSFIKRDGVIAIMRRIS